VQLRHWCLIGLTFPGLRAQMPITAKTRRRRDTTTRQSTRKNATRSLFSCVLSLVPRIRLKYSTVSSSVKSRPSWRYDGVSLTPRSGKVLMGSVGRHHHSVGPGAACRSGPPASYASCCHYNKVADGRKNIGLCQRIFPARASRQVMLWRGRACCPIPASELAGSPGSLEILP